jgi:pimeloyl-ACP methyl ester carboxylesterase
MTARPALILLPGMPLDAALWEHQVRHLADVADVQVIETTLADTLSGLAHAVLARAPERFLLAGLSLGGYVAQEILRQAPERVAKLALVNTNARPDTPEQAETRRRAMEVASSRGLDPILDAMIPKLIAPSRVGDAELTGAVRAMGQRVGVENYLRQQAAILSRPDGRPSLPAIRCPTLVIGGREDGGSPPPVQEEMANAIPGARLVLIEECGHLSPLERPHAVTALLREWVLYG